MNLKQFTISSFYCITDVTALSKPGENNSWVTFFCVVKRSYLIFRNPTKIRLKTERHFCVPKKKKRRKKEYLDGRSTGYVQHLDERSTVQTELYTREKVYEITRTSGTHLEFNLFPAISLECHSEPYI